MPGNWKAFNAADLSTHGLRDDGTLWLWGAFFRGDEEGGVFTQAIVLEPEQVGSDAGWQSISGDGETMLGIRDDGTLWYWGMGLFGLPQAEPVPWPGADGGAPWTSISAGGWHVCGIQTDGTLWCAGNNEYGNLGSGTLVGQIEPVRVVGETSWSAVAAGGQRVNPILESQFTCALDTDGGAWCWGDNAFGQLGDGTLINSSTPVRIKDPQ